MGKEKPCLRLTHHGPVLLKKYKLISLINFCQSIIYDSNTLRFQRLFVFILLAFISINKISAQPSSQDPNWISDAVVNKVQFYHVIVECNGKNVVFLKFDNKNNYEVSVSWKELFETQIDNSIEGFTGKKEMVIPKGITMPAGCSDIANKKNIILPAEVSPLYVAEIKKFNFKNIYVTRAN